MNKKTVIKFNILAIICIILFCATIAPITLQNDTYYTIPIGKHIIENGIDILFCKNTNEKHRNKKTNKIFF